MADNEIPAEDTMNVDASSKDVIEELLLEEGCIGNADVEVLKMQEAAAGVLNVKGHADLSRSGAGLIVSEGDVELFQSGAVVAIADRADIKQGYVGMLAAREAMVDEDSQVLITAKNAVILGVVSGLVFGLIAAIGDYLIRGMDEHPYPWSKKRQIG